MMIYFRLQNDDIRLWTDHAHWDAEHGRTKLAIARMDTLAGYFPRDPHVEYDRGLLWYHHAGNAPRAREHFLRAYEFATRLQVRGTQWFAARYLWKVVKSAEESMQWIGRALEAAPPNEPERKVLEQCRQQLQEIEYADAMWVHALGGGDRTDFGTAASLAEVSLAARAGDPQTEATRRGKRAEWLRMLDRAEQQQRLTMAEQ